MTCKVNADTTNGLKLTSDTSGEIDLQTNGTTKVHMADDGRVGIGTSSPSGSLHINTSEANILIADTDDGNGSYGRVRSDSSGSLHLEADVGNNTGSSTMRFNIDGSERMRIDASGNLKFDSGYGSFVTAYGVRAWVNFNGTGTVAIRESGGVSSVADRGTGQYTVVLSTAMPDNNYCGVTSAIHDISSSTNRNRIANAYTKDTNEVYVNSFDTGGNASDVEQVNVVIVR